jgi:hypothetical protein
MQIASVLRDVFRNCQAAAALARTVAEIVLIESPRTMTRLPRLASSLTTGGQILIEELSFIDADDFRVVLDELEKRS